MRVALLLAILSCCGAMRVSAQRLQASSEFSRPDPFGGIIAADGGGALADSIRVPAARGAYASLHVVAAGFEGAYELRLNLPFESTLYREWFHLNTSDSHYYPDALIPVRTPYQSRLPEPTNRVPGQKSQAFWVDVWVPASAKAAVYHGNAELRAQGRTVTLPIELDVRSVETPNEDAVMLDNNSYGTSWMTEQFPKTLASLATGNEAELLRLIHAYHRIFYEHRGDFHQLGYGHAGKVGPEFAPVLSGAGKTKHVADWTLFDRHYGPLLDGSAFANTHRGPRPVPFIYLPVNPEWPASYLWWGEPGYEAEFTNVLSDIERHFREKKWTSTNLEVFFNHKKRYKGFNWDGDEVRFDRDNEYLIAYHRMLEKAIPHNTPVKFVMRADVSWDMERQFSELKNVVKFWVAGQGMLSWYPDAVRQLRQRGDIVWTYGGTPQVKEMSEKITADPLRSWISGVQGFVRWLTVSPGPDPWFHFGGGGETLVYSGERFGIAGPIPSVRLKLQRNCLQDIAILERAATGDSREAVQSEVVRRFNGTSLADWHNTRPPLADTPVVDWNNTDIGEAERPFDARIAVLKPGGWAAVREYALEPRQ